MSDDTVDLQFLARQGRQILDELRDGRAEMEIMRTDNRRVLGELASSRASMAGISTEMAAIHGAMAGLSTEVTITRGEIAIGAIRDTMGAILDELRETRLQNASFANRLRRIEEGPG